MNNFVIDASVASKWLFLEKGSDEAEKLLMQFSTFFVPDLFVIEMHSIISKKVRKGELNAKEAPSINDKFNMLPYKLLAYSEITDLAFDIATSLPVTIYDACYIATAIQKDAVVFTADQRLVNGLSNTMLRKYVQSIW